MAAARTTLAAISCFTAAAACWLVVMYFILRHPGYQWRAAIAALFVLQSALTLVLMASGGPEGVYYLRPIVLAGACGIVWAGYSAISATLSAAHFEGFWLPIGGGLVLQGVLTLTVFLKLQDFKMAGWHN